jgi:choline dehydrogenase-like flavoprotein
MPAQPADLSTDVLIVGGGAAGLALAAELDAQGVDVILAERGPDRTRPVAPQQTGPCAFNMDGRRYRLAGGLNDWGANCALLDPEDFEPRPGYADWPIPMAELEARTARVAQWLGLSVADLRPGRAGDTAAHGLFKAATAPGSLATRTKSFARTDPLYLPSKLRARVLDRTLQKAGRIRVLQGCQCRKLEMGPGPGQVRAAILTTSGARSLRIVARRFVVAAGADTVPFLLQALGETPEIVAARWPALGRFLHAHLMPLHGLARLPQPANAALQNLIARHSLPLDLGLTPLMHLRRKLGVATDPARSGFALDSFSGLQITPEVRRAEQLVNGVCWLAPVWAVHPLQGPRTRASAGELARTRQWHNPLTHSLLGRLGLPPVVALRHFIEQPARPEARLVVRPDSGARDGIRLEVEWAIGADERRTLEYQARVTLAALKTAGFTPGPEGSIAFDDPDMTRNAHPMGGAIMGVDPGRSVVDADLRMHGLGNLYLCGGAVLPRGGAAMVTGVILQLALRLADHLAGNRA